MYLLFHIAIIMLQEIEERAPALQKQREEYLLATETVTALQQQIQDNNQATQTLVSAMKPGTIASVQYSKIVSLHSLHIIFRN